MYSAYYCKSKSLVFSQMPDVYVFGYVFLWVKVVYCYVYRCAGGRCMDYVGSVGPFLQRYVWRIVQGS